MSLGESTLEDKLYYRGRPSQPKMSQLGSELKWSQAEKHELRSELRHCGLVEPLGLYQPILLMGQLRPRGTHFTESYFESAARHAPSLGPIPGGRLVKNTVLG